MSVTKLDTTGLKCPEPILKIAALSTDLQPDDILEVTGNCLTFERDVRSWCERLKKTLVFVRNDGTGRITCQIQI
jgi:tRNA 2-thiouridine synthesizing protein A